MARDIYGRHIEKGIRTAMIDRREEYEECQL